MTSPSEPITRGRDWDAWILRQNWLSGRVTGWEPSACIVHDTGRAAFGDHRLAQFTRELNRPPESDGEVVAWLYHSGRAGKRSGHIVVDTLARRWYRCVPLDMVSWHASSVKYKTYVGDVGRAKQHPHGDPLVAFPHHWRGGNLNAATWGAEFVWGGRTPSDCEVDAAVRLLRQLGAVHIAGHSQVDPLRRTKGGVAYDLTDAQTDALLRGLAR